MKQTFINVEKFQGTEKKNQFDYLNFDSWQNGVRTFENVSIIVAMKSQIINMLKG